MSITILIIAATCVVSFVAFNNRATIDRLILWPPAVKRGREYWRLVTYGLIHADGNHLLFNMITLYFFGQAMEPLYVREIGDVGYVLFYLGALVASILPSYLRNQDNPAYRSLGASGAVSAILFAFILVRPWATILLFYAVRIPAIVYAVLYVAYSIYMDRRGRGNVNHSAHLWGAAYGVVFTLIMDPARVDTFLESLVNPSFR